VFSVLPHGGQAKNQIGPNFGLGRHLRRGKYLQSFRSIAPAATKLGLQIDDDDRQHVIVRAHQINCASASGPTEFIYIAFSIKIVPQSSKFYQIYMEIAW
jgi:hypothetical protein